MEKEVKINNEVVFNFWGERQEGYVIGFADYMREDGEVSAIILCTDGIEREVLPKDLTVVNRNDG